jgi:hypothetical protein
MTEQRITLDAADAAELIDLFAFLDDWFLADQHRLDDSLWWLCSMRLRHLRKDLWRFADLLGHAPMTTGADQ